MSSVDPKVIVQPNVPTSERLEVVQPGRYSAATQSVSTYPQINIPSNDGMLGIITVQRYS